MPPGRTWTLLGSLIACAALAVLGYLVGAVPLTGVEPGGAYVDCGPALFGRESPLPHPTCEDAFTPLPQLSAVLLSLAAVCGALGVVLAGRLWSARARS